MGVAAIAARSRRLATRAFGENWEATAARPPRARLRPVRAPVLSPASGSRPREPSPESEASGAALYARAFRRLTFSGSFGSFLMSPFTSSMNWVTSLNWR